jgi:2-polyprenyl-3-methyl-5-hydroxy-6-metoxy-1,4-benzoquinol methylase
MAFLTSTLAVARGTTYHSTKIGGPHETKAFSHMRGRVLDIGFGAGRIAIYLQKKGFDVLGIDVSPFAILVCKLRGLRRAKLISITQLSPSHRTTSNCPKGAGV